MDMIGASYLNERFTKGRANDNYYQIWNYKYGREIIRDSYVERNSY